MGLLLRLPVLTSDMVQRLLDDFEAHPGLALSDLDKHLEACAERVLMRMTGRHLGSWMRNAVEDIADQRLVPRLSGDAHWQEAFSSSI
eukprot:6776980-Karenia_brevis.AAC.1